MKIKQVISYILNKVKDLSFDNKSADSYGENEIFYCNKERAIYLIGKGISINKLNKQGRNCLFFMMHNRDNKDKEKLEILFENGLNINIIDNEGKNALWFCDVEIAKFIIDKGLDLCIFNEHPEKIKELPIKNQEIISEALLIKQIEKEKETIKNHLFIDSQKNDSKVRKNRL